MKSEEKEISARFRSKLKDLRRKLFPAHEGEVWLYGSRARGDYHAGSDWDLIVVTEEGDSFSNFKKFAFPFIQLGIDHGQDVIPLLYSREEWSRESRTLFYQNVISDSISI